MKNEELITLTLPYPGGREKKIRIYVPAHDDGEVFPVVYMTDGQNLFDETPEMFGCWHTREAVAAERDQTGKAAIIVGVHNDERPEVRTNDLTPGSIGPVFIPPEVTEETEEIIPAGEIFDAFIVDTVMPAVEARFPVKTGRENTAFCGSSSGGLQAFFTVFSHPDRFGAGGVLSPAFMAYAPHDLENWIRSHVGAELPYLYLYSGGEAGLEELIRSSTETVGGMLKKFYPSSLLHTVILPGKPHHESAWEPVFRDFLHIFLTR